MFLAYRSRKFPTRVAWVLYAGMERLREFERVGNCLKASQVAVPSSSLGRRRPNWVGRAVSRLLGPALLTSSIQSGEYTATATGRRAPPISARRRESAAS